MKKPRCELIFEQSIKSEHTREGYSRGLRYFMEFIKVQSYDQLLEGDQKGIQEKVEDYTISLKNRISPNSFGMRLAPIFLFYAINDIILNTIKIKKMFPAKVKVSGYNAYSRNDIETMLSCTNKKRTKAIILVFSSTGARVGAIVGLNVGDILDTVRNDCKCLRFYARDREEYFGFLTPEATRALNEYLEQRRKSGEKLDEQSPMFTLKDRLIDKKQIGIKRISRPAISNILTAVFRHMNRTRDGNRWEIPTTHGFRKYFNRALKMREGMNLSLCEKLMGHSVTVALDNSYLPVTKDELFKEFEKAIPELTIREDERNQLRIRDLEVSREQEENKTHENKLLKEQLDILKLRMERMEVTNNV
ncbi:MAG: site-specific integrase [Nitrosopumilus sp.]|nr:site-specific integrase [Nitrosopumilus sp.]MDF2424556.1 site-specific integrase [Nitrosopumilus sp.]MDF2425943.1 site-specific integrase [Nitrosopumilus sp.]MDF2426944.1 site-specific integrase [Nitrosopumilus sp.]MDF2428418.1 site-specific integrase [Nitrosopumilus sp.]